MRDALNAEKGFWKLIELERFWMNYDQNYTKQEALTHLRKRAKELGITVNELIENYIGLSKSTFYDWGETAQRLFVSYMNTTTPPEEEDKEILKENVRYKKQTQRFMDTNRIERKAFREHARIENSITEYTKELVSLLQRYNFDIHNSANLIKTKGDHSETLVVQVSDVHFNELVKLENNEYNFKVASKRLAKYAQTIKELYPDETKTNLIIAFTGDLMNSDRRMDELLNQATNRANASILAVDILRGFIADLADWYGGCTCLSVSGNESRLDKEAGNTDFMMTNNYDSNIFNILAMLFKDSQGINFRYGNPVEQLVQIQGKNILFTHGMAFSKNTEVDVQKAFGRYAGYGHVVDYAIFGHLHSPFISDYFARSGSLVGANAYSERKLNVSGRASQNIHVITKDDIHSTKIDLQNVDGIKGYSFMELDDCYNPKSLLKICDEVPVIKIII